MNSKKSISVILPNYNGKHLMELYIPSVLATLHHSEIDFEFIIIDDCSKDDSITFIEENYPEILLLKNKKNSGFSHTCNKGIFHATKELVFLLNSDVKLTIDYFEAQWKHFDSETTFGVMGCVLNFDEIKIEDAARLPRYKGLKFKANTFYYSENPLDSTYTTYLSGANALVNREKLLLLKGFDEIYSPFYFEDFDLGLRAWKMGWFLYYEHKSKCFHKVSASTNNINKSNFVKITYNRNSMILQSIHLNGFKRKLWYVQLLTLNLLGHLLKGEFWILKSVDQFFKKQNDIKESRLAILSLQKELKSEKTLDSIILTIKSSIKDKVIKWL
jgi:GT2 family glycosyltransferase